MPIWLTDRMLGTMRYFNRFISMQAAEAVYVFFRKWNGSWHSGTPASYTYNTIYERYEFTLWTPPVPLTGGRPRLKSLKMYLDGDEMTEVPTYNLTTSNLDFWGEIDRGGPRDPDAYGALIVGFHEGLDPSSHVVGYEYERICTCIDVGEESFHPKSRCTICYGTGYIGGYDQYICAPEVEAGRTIKPANTILSRFPITTEAVRITKYGGEIITSRRNWAIASPLLHDWDMLVRQRRYGAPINVDPRTGNIVTERYWITDWEHSSARFSYGLPLRAQPGVPAVDGGITLHQRFATTEIQPNHIAYQIPISAG